MKGYFHESNGLFFKRLENGDVYIVKKETGKDDAPTVFEHRISKNIWLSVVCVVSELGEANGRYLEAEKFHG